MAAVRNQQQKEEGKKKQHDLCVQVCLFLLALHTFVITVYWPLGDMSLSARTSQEESSAVFGLHHSNTPRAAPVRKSDRFML